MVKDCKNDASYWVSNVCNVDTFYLCSDCACELANDNFEYIQLEENLDGTFEIIPNEIAGYGCHEDCPVCNNG